MNINEDRNLLCPTCKFEYNHLIGTITVEDNDHYTATKFIITLSGKTYEIDSNVKYSYRSQGNIHLLFECEAGHYHFVSFDGHKGIMFVDDNKVFDKLSLYLNETISNSESPYLPSTYKLLSLIEDFLEQDTN